MKILPSPISPVRAARMIASTTFCSAASPTTTSTLTLGTRSIVYSAPRYCSLWPFCRPKPRTSVTVRPWMPAWVRAVLTSSSLYGLMIASTNFISVLLPSFQDPGLRSGLPPGSLARNRGGRDRGQGPRADSSLDRRFALLSRADPDDALEREDEDLSVADLPGPGRSRNCLDDGGNRPVGDDHLQFDLGHQIDRVLRAAVLLFMAFLPAEAADLSHGEALDPDLT